MLSISNLIILNCIGALWLIVVVLIVPISMVWLSKATLYTAKPYNTALMHAWLLIYIRKTTTKVVPLPPYIQTTKTSILWHKGNLKSNFKENSEQMELELISFGFVGQRMIYHWVNRSNDVDLERSNSVMLYLLLFL